MTISEDMVERAARAIVHECNERGEYDTPASEWAIADLKNHHIWEDAFAALTAALQGSVVVPAEPTTKMFGAFISATLAIDHTDLPAGAFEAFCVDYRAMLAAAPTVSRHEHSTPAAEDDPR